MFDIVFWQITYLKIWFLIFFFKCTYKLFLKKTYYLGVPDNFWLKLASNDSNIVWDFEEVGCSPVMVLIDVVGFQFEFLEVYQKYSNSRKKWRWPKVFCFWIILYNSQLLERASQGGKWSYRITVVIIHTHLLMWHHVTKLEVDLTPCSQQFSITRLSSWSKSSQW